MHVPCNSMCLHCFVWPAYFRTIQCIRPRLVWLPDDLLLRRSVFCIHQFLGMRIELLCGSQYENIMLVLCVSIIDCPSNHAFISRAVNTVVFSRVCLFVFSPGELAVTLHTERQCCITGRPCPCIWLNFPRIWCSYTILWHSLPVNTQTAKEDIPQIRKNHCGNYRVDHTPFNNLE